MSNLSKVNRTKNTNRKTFFFFFLKILVTIHWIEKMVFDIKKVELNWQINIDVLSQRTLKMKEYKVLESRKKWKYKKSILEDRIIKL